MGLLQTFCHSCSLHKGCGLVPSVDLVARSQNTRNNSWCVELSGRPKETDEYHCAMQLDLPLLEETSFKKCHFLMDHACLYFEFIL